MIIIISGLAGCGKSSLADSLGKRLSLPVIHASSILKQLETKKIEEIEIIKLKKGKGFWESKKGMQLVKKRLADSSMDKALDKKLLEIIEKGNAILDSKTMAYLSRKGKKIWLQCSLQTRAERIAKRDAIEKATAFQRIGKRDETDKKIYKKLYDFDLGKGLEKFDLIINNENLSRQKTLKRALDFLNK